MELLSVGFYAPVSEFSVSSGDDVSDDPFHWSPTVVKGDGLGLFPPLSGSVEQTMMGVDRQVASCFAGCATTPVGTVVTDRSETNKSFRADGGGVTGRAGYLSVFGVDHKVVAGELVGFQPGLGTLGDGFDRGPVTGLFQGGSDVARSVGRIGDNLGTRFVP